MNNIDWLGHAINMGCKQNKKAPAMVAGAFYFVCRVFIWDLSLLPASIFCKILPIHPPKV